MYGNVPFNIDVTDHRSAPSAGVDINNLHRRSRLAFDMAWRKLKYFLACKGDLDSFQRFGTNMVRFVVNDEVVSKFSRDGSKFFAPRLEARS